MAGSGATGPGVGVSVTVGVRVGVRVGVAVSVGGRLSVAVGIAGMGLASDSAVNATAVGKKSAGIGVGAGKPERLHPVKKKMARKIAENRLIKEKTYCVFHNHYGIRNT